MSALNPNADIRKGQAQGPAPTRSLAASLKAMPQTAPRSIHRENIPQLRKALRKAGLQLKPGALRPSGKAESARELSAAAAILAWLARTAPSKWPPCDWDPSAWPQGLRDTLNGLIADDAGIESSDMRSAVTLLGESSPRSVWLADDVLGWVYEICSEGAGARRRTGRYFTPVWLSELLLLCLQALHDGQEASSGSAQKHIRILDPACGSGAFLLSAAHILTGPRLSPQEPRGPQGARSIGLDNLFGLDIDETALALAGLSLAFLGHDRGEGFHIDSANLGRSDFLDKVSGLSFGTVREAETAADSKRLLPSQLEPKFDLIVGNPPYLGFHHHSSEYRRRILKQYSVFDGKADVFYYFMERGLECLRDGGVLGYVVPRYWLGADKAARLRRFLAQKSELICLLDFERMPVFARAGVQVCVLVLRKRLPKPLHRLEVIRPLDDSPLDDPSVLFRSGLPRVGAAHEPPSVTRFGVQQKLLGDSWVLVPSKERSLMSAIEAASDACLGELASVSPGLITGLDKVRPEGSRRGRRIQEGVFVLSEKEIEALDLLPAERSLVKPWIKNSHVERWTVNDSDLCVLYITSRPDAASMPNLTRHLERFRPILEARYEIALSDRPWWRLVRPRKPEQFDGAVPKIVVPYKAAQSRFAVDCGRHFCSADVYCINAHDGLLPEYLCCLLNSRLLEFYFRRIAKKMGRTYEYYAHTLVRLPIRVASMAVQQRLKALHDELVAQIRNDGSTGPRSEEALRELEQSVNQMVCDVYGIDCGQLFSAKP